MTVPCMTAPCMPVLCNDCITTQFIDNFMFRFITQRRFIVLHSVLRNTLHDCTACMTVPQSHDVPMQCLYYCAIYWQVNVSFPNSILPGQAAADSSVTLQRSGQLHSNCNASMLIIESFMFRSLSFIDRFVLRVMTISRQQSVMTIFMEAVLQGHRSFFVHSKSILEVFPMLIA